MALLEDINLFAAVISRGGFSHAAKYLGLSNGLVSRRIAQLEKKLGVTLLMRTTRQLHLTPEGELLWQHAKRIQGELDAAIGVINSLSAKPQGTIRISAPVFFGREILLPITMKFLENFSDIKIDLLLTNDRLDPIKENLDLIIRATGFLEKAMLKDSSLRMKFLMRQKIDLYASPQYLQQQGLPAHPDDLKNHMIIGYVDRIQYPEKETWIYKLKNKSHQLDLTPRLKCNDMGSSLSACLAGQGVAKLTWFAAESAVKSKSLIPLLTNYDWGELEFFVIYANQQSLPKRTRLLLEFINAEISPWNRNQ